MNWLLPPKPTNGGPLALTMVALALLSLICLIPTRALAADSYTHNGCSLSPRTTSQRTIHLQGQVPAATVWVWIEIKQGSSSEDIFIYRPPGGRFDLDLFARYGPGKYQVTIYRTTNPLQYGTKYVEHAKLYFTNTHPSLGLRQVTSTNSAIYLDMPLYPQETLLHIQISSPASPDQEAIFQLPAARGSMARLHLPFGPSRHDVKIWGIDAAGQDFSYNEFSVVNEDYRNLVGLLPSPEVQSDDPGVVALAQKVTAGASSDREKARLLHQWVAKNIRYDAAGVQSGAYRDTPQDALSTLERGEGVCVGYANLYAALLRAVNVPTKVVSGVAGQNQEVDLTLDYSLPTNRSALEQWGHAWNKVLIQGTWLNVDVTWDAGHVRRNRFYPHYSTTYFLRTDSDFGRDHLWLADEPF